MNRTLVASLTITASALVGLAVHEGYCGEACIPVKGDRPTLGFGDAQGVKLGQKTDPVRALIRLNFQAEAFQHAMRQCVGDVPMTVCVCLHTTFSMRPGTPMSSAPIVSEDMVPAGAEVVATQPPWL
jgi:hypothetical protein